MLAQPDKGLIGPNHEFKTHTLPVAILLFICFWSFFYNTGTIELNSMEARNLVTSREMRLYDHWLVPTMNGSIRIAKPPLPTWIAALVSTSAGGSENMSLMRMPNALAALLLVLMAYGLVWTLSKDRTLAFIAAAVLASNFLVMKVGQRAMWDIFCHSFMLGALWAFVDGIRNNRGWPKFALAGLLMGLSFMSKGPVSFFALMLPFTVSYLWIYGRSDLLSKWPHIVMAFLLCISISSLWPLYILYFHPEALIETAAAESQAWVGRHVKELGYYLGFSSYSGLWLVMTLAALVKPFAEKRVRSVPDYRFFLLWLVLEIVLLSAVPEKKYRYLLPAMIPMALLAATLFRGLMDRYAAGTEQAWDRRLLIIQLCWLTLVGALLPAIMQHRMQAMNADADPLLIGILAAIALLLVAASWYLFRLRHLMGLFLLISVQYCVIAFVFMDYYRDLEITNPEFKTMDQLDPARLPRNVQIFLIQNYDGTKYAWDLKRTVRPWRLEEVKPILDSGGQVAVITIADPYRTMAEEYPGKVEISIVGRFDYDENHPQDEKTFLILVRANE